MIFSGNGLKIMSEKKLVMIGIKLKRKSKFKIKQDKTMEISIINSIKKMIPKGNRLELPKDEQFTNYQQVKKSLITAGGKYKRCGFEFPDDAKVVQDRLVGGEVIDDKKKYQFFATPPELARKLVELADIQKYNKCLEPSAGHGAISDLILDISGNCVVVELMPENIKVLSRKGYSPMEGDFLEKKPEIFGTFDRIVANPPFTKNQDIDHILHMFSMLNPCGKLVSVASKSWMQGAQKKQKAFREWLDEIEATVTDIPPGSFKESGTLVGAVIVEAYRVE